MKHDHPVIRYWGALGCTIRGESAKAAAGQLTKLLNDPVPAVRVAAAEALAVQGDTGTGVKGLVTVLRETSDAVVALEVLNIAEALGVTGEIPKNATIVVRVARNTKELEIPINLKNLKVPTAR